MTAYPFSGPLGVDETGSSSGTAVDAATINTLAVANSFIMSGGIPGAAGFPTVSQPATTAVINTGLQGGTSAQVVTVSGTTVGLSTGPTTAQDQWVILNTSGAYRVATVNHTATPSPPAISSGEMILYYCTTNSTNTAVASINQWASYYPFGADTLAATTNLTPSATMPTGGSSIGDCLRYLLQSISSAVDSAARAALNTLLGTTGSGFSANTKKAILEDGSNAAATVSLPSTVQVTAGKVEAQRGLHVPASKGDTSSVVWIDTLSTDVADYQLHLSVDAHDLVMVDKYGHLYAPAGPTPPTFANGGVGVSGWNITGSDVRGIASADLVETAPFYVKLGEVTFANPYNRMPVVVVSITSGGGVFGFSASAVNVSATGFDIYIAGSTTVSGVTADVSFFVIG